MKKEYVVQVKLKSNGTETVGWVDEHMAKVGKRVAIEDEGYDKDRVWIITEVWDRRLKSSIANQEAAQREFANKLEGH